MGEASLNGKSIGLWNYMEKEGKCNGCFGRYFVSLTFFVTDSNLRMLYVFLCYIKAMSLDKLQFFTDD